MPFATIAARSRWVAAITRASSCDRLGIADALERALLQHAQQLGLQLERDLGDLVEEQRALAGELEPAGAIGDRAGERALDVTEQLALEHAGRERGAVDRDERLVAVGGRAVDRARDQLLAGAGLAADQHRRARRRHRADLLPHVADRGALAEDVAGLVRRASARARRAGRATSRLSSARRTTARRRSMSTGLTRYSYAPSWIALTVDCMSSRAVTTTTVGAARPIGERGEHVEAAAAGQAEIEQHQVGAVARAAIALGASCAVATS